MSKKVLQVIVIGRQGALRNPNLESQLRGHSVSYVPPVEVLDKAKVESEWARVANRNILGRNLVNGEVGCALAHEAARALIDSDWALILEDDADVPPKTISWIAANLKDKSATKPTVVTLIEIKPSHKKFKIVKLRHMPGQTVAYLASRSTSDLDKSPYSRVGPADWPYSFEGAKFCRLAGSGVTEHQSPSTIDETGDRTRNSRSFYVNAISKSTSVFRALGFKGVKYSLIFPLIRDVSNRTLGRLGA
jgi:hypothetical protein